MTVAPKLHVKKNDTVIVLSGVDRGKRGRVLEVLPKTGKVVVEGVRLQKKHTRPSQELPQGGIIEQPGKLDASKVQVVCPHCDQPTRTAKERNDDGFPVRVCKKCGKQID
ncbi:MAG TPA: 50S ribosomal protein L24 [Firmicutes bacterium]|nr:50S ribosomal protein L24 [Bacillota bacterium]